MNDKTKKNIIELTRISLDDYRHSSKLPLTIVADNIRSMNNIGSIFRTADAFAIEQIILCGITPTPPHPDIHKTALGAEQSVNWKYCNNTLQAIETLKQNGYTICCLEQTHNSIDLRQFKPDSTKKYALVAGNEVDGVSQQIIDTAHCTIEIPQLGTKHSLNVSCSAAIAMWQFFQTLKIG